MRISDWSSDVCSSDLVPARPAAVAAQDAAVGKGAGGMISRRDLIVGGLCAGGMGAASALVPRTVMASHRDVTLDKAIPKRSEERRVGKACDSTWRSRW